MSVPLHRRQRFARKPRAESEASLTKRCQGWLARQKSDGSPLWWYKTHGDGYAKAGIPDLCIVVAGRSLWVELKTEKGVVSPIQDVRMREIREAGGVACVCRSVEELAEIVFEMFRS